MKAELIYGAEKSNRREDNLNKINTFLMLFDIITFGDTTSILYGEVRVELERSDTPIGPNDLIIASTVLAEQGVLVTNNVKEFKRVDQLRIENWIEI